jgi:Arc/MetJ-type ribon-helix-helix transcriptional regulator
VKAAVVRRIASRGGGRGSGLDRWRRWSHITFMALARKKATTIALDPEDDRLLSRAARERGVSRSEFIRQHLALVLEQYRRHPKPRSAGIVRTLTGRGDERELFSGGR